jgi:phage regulator Rha-like protein
MLKPETLSARGYQPGPSAKQSIKKTAIVPGEAESGKSLVLTPTRNEQRIDSRLLARELRNQHRPVMALIDRYADTFGRFGKVLFQKAPSAHSRTGQRERFALLNEDQAYFLLALSRNTEHVVELKAKLVAAFQAARKAAELRQSEYLPAYHQLHDALHLLADGASHERFLHMNVNKLVNRAADVEPGSRWRAPVPKQGLLIAAQVIAAGALSGAADHREAYDRVKAALAPLYSRPIGQEVTS